MGVFTDGLLYGVSRYKLRTEKMGRRCYNVAMTTIDVYNQHSEQPRLVKVHEQLSTG